MWMARKSFFCPTKLPPEPSHSLLLVTPNPPGSDTSNGNQHSRKASLRVTSLTAAPGLCSCSSQKRTPLITHFCHFLQCLRPDLHPSPRDIDII